MNLFPGEDYSGRRPEIFFSEAELLSAVANIQPFWRGIEVSMETNLGWRILYRGRATGLATALRNEHGAPPYRLLVSRHPWSMKQTE